MWPDIESQRVLVVHRIGPVSAGRLVAMVSVFLSLIYLLLMLPEVLRSGKLSLAFRMPMLVGVSGAIGFGVGAVLASLFNLAASHSGGIRLEIATENDDGDLLNDGDLEMVRPRNT